jgi:hypothetical protein
LREFFTFAGPATWTTLGSVLLKLIAVKSTLSVFVIVNVSVDVPPKGTVVRLKDRLNEPLCARLRPGKTAPPWRRSTELARKRLSVGSPAANRARLFEKWRDTQAGALNQPG